MMEEGCTNAARADDGEEEGIEDGQDSEDGERNTDVCYYVGC